MQSAPVLPRFRGTAAEDDHMLIDAEAEKRWGFSLSATLAAARARPLLQNRACVIGPNTKPDAAALSEILRHSGAVVAASVEGLQRAGSGGGPALYVAADGCRRQAVALVSKWAVGGPVAVLEVDDVLTSVLRQRLPDAPAESAAAPAAPVGRTRRPRSTASSDDDDNNDNDGKASRPPTRRRRGATAGPA